MLVDTHCHINLMVKKDFNTTITENHLIKAAQIINEARKSGVKYIINVGTNLTESLNCIKIAKKFDGVYAAVGLHPTDCKKFWKKELEEIKKLITKKENKIAAIGETGLDLYWSNNNLPMQIDSFKAQLEIAMENELPVIIHTRKAQSDMIQTLQEYKNQIKGVMHCFSGDRDFAEQALDIGLMLGIGGIISYPKNHELRKIVSQIDLSKIVLETDAPFLPPQIIRGKQNHPKYIAYIAEYLSKIMPNQSFSSISKQTSANAFNLFKLMKSRLSANKLI